MPQLELDQVHLPDPVLNDILELYKENKELKLQLRKVCSCMQDRKSLCGHDENMICKKFDSEVNKEEEQDEDL